MLLLPENEDDLTTADLSSDSLDCWNKQKVHEENIKIKFEIFISQKSTLKFQCKKVLTEAMRSLLLERRMVRFLLAKTARFVSLQVLVEG
jgi:hypothetical protein